MLCVKKDGTVIIVMEKKFGLFTYFGLGYLIGKLNVNGDQTKWKVDFKPTMADEIEATQIAYITGVEPTVACHENKVFVICHRNISTLIFIVGTLDHGNTSISSWKEENPLEGAGICPSISINSEGYIVESHSTVTRSIVSSAGKVEGDTIRWRHEKCPHTGGEFPSISLADDRYVITLHKRELGYTIFSQEGNLHDGH